QSEALKGLLAPAATPGRIHSRGRSTPPRPVGPPATNRELSEHHETSYGESRVKRHCVSNLIFAHPPGASLRPPKSSSERLGATLAILSFDGTTTVFDALSARRRLLADLTGLSSFLESEPAISGFMPSIPS